MLASFAEPRSVAGGESKPRPRVGMSEMPEAFYLMLAGRTLEIVKDQHKPLSFKKNNAAAVAEAVPALRIQEIVRR